MFETLLDKTCSVERQVPTQSTTGGNVPTWTARLANVPCALQKLRGIERDQFARDDSLNYYKVYTTTDIAATTQDRITINGTSYGVVAYEVDENAVISPNPVCKTIVFTRR